MIYNMSHKLVFRRSLAFFFLILFSSCASYEYYKNVTEEFEMPSKVFVADYNEAWQAVLQVMKKFDLSYQNQEGGVIITKWIDNTGEVNFSDSFGSDDTVKGAKFKLSLNVVKGYRSSKEITKITLYKRQLIEQDFLQGWKEIPTDQILEKTLLYRIERIVLIDKKLKDIEKKREQKEIEQF
jgi:hypothetical protein